MVKITMTKEKFIELWIGEAFRSSSIILEDYEGLQKDDDVVLEFLDVVALFQILDINDESIELVYIITHYRK